MRKRECTTARRYDFVCSSSAVSQLGFQWGGEKRQIQSHGEASPKIGDSPLLTQSVDVGVLVWGHSGGKTWVHRKSSGPVVQLSVPPAYLGRGFRNPWSWYSSLLSLGEWGACVAMVMCRS